MRNLILCVLLIFSYLVHGQNGIISGEISSNNELLEFASVQIKGTSLGTITNENGYFKIQKVPFGEHTVIASYAGLKPLEKHVDLNDTQSEIAINFNLNEPRFQLDQVVVTGTRTNKKQTQSPVIVNVIDSKTLDDVQACNLSEGLKFQPGLRVETDCQTCNYTQLRMNGLEGSYSQILINGRPVFSPLTGLYGLEQIPRNMIERIEVVKGGGSALYGTSAIGGTVNIITRMPEENAFSVSNTYQNINGRANDNILNGNATVVNEKGNAGISLFLNNRNRAYYDHNGDNFSELPQLKNNSFGANMFFKPSENQKLELSMSSLYEYRYGGEMVNEPPHIALQSEERTHDVYMGNIDYQINFNDDNSSFITYLAAQNTDRTHYTGIFPDDSMAITTHLEDPPYGISKTSTLQGGVQFNHRMQNFLGGSNVLTVGSEYVTDDVLDEIDAYKYKIDQVTKNFAVFLQSDWKVTPNVNLLTGLRADKHNLLDKVIYSPRASLLYRLKNTTQFRFTWSTGFRAPQAFDTDLHIAFAGGGISRISLSPDLNEERSNSFSASVNYDKATEHFIAGFTIEGFYTQLNGAFYQHPIGEDEFGERFEKRNGTGATVQGATLELRANYDQIAQLEAGVNIQSSLYDEPIENLEGLAPKREFLRSPNEYGYATFSFMPSDRFNTSINVIYTGPMELMHLAGAPEQSTDSYKTSQAFTELSFKTGYTFNLTNLNSGIEVFGGIKNLTNAYQDDFDTGKNRDSNYIYGPSSPRTFFVGLKIMSL